MYFWLQETSEGKEAKRDNLEMDQEERWLWLKGDVVDFDF